MSADTVLYEQDFEQIRALCVRLQREANARAILLIDKNGQVIAEAGDTYSLDVTSLASLTASAIAATNAIAALIAEQEFDGQFHEGQTQSVLVQLVGGKLILVVIFDRAQSNQGIVKLRVRKATQELSEIFDQMLARAAQQPSIFTEITDDDIDNLFSD